MNIKREIEILPPDALDSCVQKFCWDCEYCKRFYSTKSYRDEHMKRMHTPVPCSTCLETFSSVSLLRKHYNNQHSKNANHSSTQDDGIEPKSSGSPRLNKATVKRTKSLAAAKEINYNVAQDVKEGEAK